MTTDITELAPAMNEVKFYAAGVIEKDGSCERAREDQAQFWTIYERQPDGTSQAVCDCDSRQGADIAAGRFNELVEELEKAQQTINEMDDRIRKQNRHVCELFDDGKALRERVAELESRTVTVKLPDNTPLADAPEQIWLQTDGVWPSDGEFSELTWCTDRQHDDDTLYVRADLLAGIKVEAE